MKALLIATVLALAALLCGRAIAAEKGPVNLDFEEGELRKVPTGWFVPRASEQAGYSIQLSDQKPKAGRRCAVISRTAKDKPKGYGNLLQRFDAAAYRGQRIRFKANVRADVTGEGNQAMLWLRVDLKDEKEGFLDNMADRPITKKGWNEYEIVGEVADDAQSISIGLMLYGNGTVGIDAASFEILGKIGESIEPSRELKVRGLENLVAFAKLYGYVRYFHPSDEAAATKWEQFALDGVGVVEAAKSPEELAARLEKLFQPIAPTVTVYVTGKAPPAAQPVKEGARLVAWYHIGVGISQQSLYALYSSKRIENKESLFEVFTKRSDAKMPDPNKPYVTDLGGGVSCSVPLALPKGDNGTLPRATAKAAVSSKPVGFVMTGNDRASRFADVIIAWNIFQHFYPYFDVVQVDWPKELKLALTAAATDKDELEFHKTLKRLVAALQDGHGSVYLRRWSGNIISAPFAWDWIEDRLVITRAASKLAEELKPGDIIVKINGRPASEVVADQEKLISGATPQWKKGSALQTLLLGPKDSAIALTVQRQPGALKMVNVIRNLDGIEADEYHDARPANIEEIKPAIWYLDIDRITDKDFEAALPKLNSAKGIIFDFRGYPGNISTAPIAHLIDKPVTSAQWHIPATLMPDRTDVHFQFSNWPVWPQKPKWMAKVAFITDDRAISKAETYLAIIENYKLAAIVGGPTAGTNGNINPFTLPDGYVVNWTGMKVLKHDSSRHHGIGIQPTVPVSRTIKGVAAGKDELIEKAIQVVRP